MDEKLDQLESKLEELSGQLSELSDKIGDIVSEVESAVEAAVESVVEDAVYSAFDDSSANFSSSTSSPLITVFTQDKKHIVPIYSFEARRWKKGEEAYAVWGRISPSGDTRLIGKYENKEIALEQMKTLAKVINVALNGGPKFYEIK